MRTSPKLWPRIEAVAAHLFLAGALLYMSIPFLWMIGASLKKQSEIFRNPPTFIPDELVFGNYINLFVEFDFLRHFLNSTFLAVVHTLLYLFFCSLAGYAFAKYEFRLKNLLFLLLLGSMMVPGYTLFVPLFVLAIRLKLVDSYIGVLLPGIVGAFGIFFMKQNMESIPDELLDAARIDGTTEFGAFWRVARPLAAPAMAVLAVLAFLNSWNDFVWPLVILRTRELQTLPVILAGMVGTYRMEYGIVMAGSFLSALPVLILFTSMQRNFMQGLTVGALRG